MSQNPRPVLLKHRKYLVDFAFGKKDPYLTPLDYHKKIEQLDGLLTLMSSPDGY